MFQAPIPGHFSQDQDHYNVNKVGKSTFGEGYTLQRSVLSNAFTRSKGLAGVDMASIPLQALAYNSWENPDLRRLSHGLWSGIVFVREPAEAVFLQRLLHRIRQDKLSLDSIATAVKAARNEEASASSNLPTVAKGPVSSTANENMAPLIDLLVSEMHKHKDASVQSDQSLTIAALQKKLELSRSGVAVSPFKPHPSSGPSKVPEITPSQTFNPGSTKPLHQQGPTGLSDNAIRKWIKSVEGELSAEQLASLHKYLADVQQYYSNSFKNKKDKPNLSELAVQWGLPIAKAQAKTKASEENLLKVCFVAAFKAG